MRRAQRLKLADKENPITGEVEPIEAQVRAEVEARKERTARELACQAAIEKVMSDHNCNFLASFKLGEQVFPTQQLVNLPVMITITSR